MDGVPTRNTPAVEGLLVDERIATLEVGRELQEGLILIFNELLGDLLLDDLLAPVVFEPRLRDYLGVSASEEQRVRLAGNVEIDLQQMRNLEGEYKTTAAADLVVDDMIV